MLLQVWFDMKGRRFESEDRGRGRVEIDGLGSGAGVASMQRNVFAKGVSVRLKKGSKATPRGRSNRRSKGR